jgi:hypothetical protein
MDGLCVYLGIVVKREAISLPSMDGGGSSSTMPACKTNRRKKRERQKESERGESDREIAREQEKATKRAIEKQMGQDRRQER